jgi:hypothetical protein
MAVCFFSTKIAVQCVYQFLVLSNHFTKDLVSADVISSEFGVFAPVHIPGSIEEDHENTSDTGLRIVEFPAAYRLRRWATGTVFK